MTVAQNVKGEKDKCWHKYDAQVNDEDEYFKWWHVGFWYGEYLLSQTGDNKEHLLLLLKMKNTTLFEIY